jgi:hypothetical protein
MAPGLLLCATRPEAAAHPDDAWALSLLAYTFDQQHHPQQAEDVRPQERYAKTRENQLPDATHLNRFFEGSLLIR